VVVEDVRGVGFGRLSTFEIILLWIFFIPFQITFFYKNQPKNYIMRKTIIILFATFFSCLLVTRALAQPAIPPGTQYAYPVTSYNITMMSQGFGWIEVKNKNEDAAYIYFTDDASQKDRFGGVGRLPYPYIVMYEPIRLWSTIIDILKNQKNLQVRGYQNTADLVTGFLETSPNTQHPAIEPMLEHISELKNTK
jgi:hypothetical protein